MGIPGLTTYIKNRNNYMQDFELYDTYLVIDGNSLATQIYSKCGVYSSFGGDYDRFSVAVIKFFNELAMCNITPLVLIDGGIEDKKHSTIIKRFSERIKLLNGYTFHAETQRTNIFPTLIKESFKEILKQQNIKFAQTTLEADSDIAAVAKILNCPILSFDSDFYIYDIPYIPYFTLDYGVVSRPNNQGYKKRCQIYHVDNLLRHVPGLDRSVLPLLAALLGNDYLKSDVFNHFFRILKLPKTKAHLYNDQQRRIHSLIHWLKNHTLDTAISAVICRLQEKDRVKVLEGIEMVVNAYRQLSPKILVAFGYNVNYVEQVTEQLRVGSYHFNQAAQQPEGGDEPGMINENNLHRHLPAWFLTEFNKGYFPGFFIDFLTRQQNITSVQIEDLKYPATVTISLPILGVMYRLVTTGIVPYKALTYVIRKQGHGYEYRTLDCPEKILGKDFPSLHKLRRIPRKDLRRMMEETIGVVGQMKVDELVESWQLYVATIVYWMKQKLEPVRNQAHLYSALFAMLFHIVDKKIGFYRKLNTFENTYGEDVKRIKEKQDKVELDMNVTLQEAIEQVTKDDCLMAAMFFIPNFNATRDLLHNYKKFNVTVVHTFSMLQSCLKHVLYLNALLDFPYKQTKFDDFFNGTFLYNLYVNFKSRNNIDTYVRHVLQNSPSLLRVFHILRNKVESMCETISLKINKERGGRRKQKKSRWGDARDLIEEISESTEAETETYYEGDNKFAVLAKSQRNCI